MKRQEKNMSIQVLLNDQTAFSEQTMATIRSFDLLSWIHEDCKIRVLEQKKIFLQNGKVEDFEKNFLDQFQASDMSLLMKELNEQNVRNGYEQYCTQRQLLRNKLNYQEYKDELQKKQIQERLKSPFHKQYMNYRKFLIKAPKNPNQQPKKVYFLIQKSKMISFQKQLVQTLTKNKLYKDKKVKVTQYNNSIIKYVLVQFQKQTKKSYLYKFDVEINRTFAEKENPEKRNALVVTVQDFDQFIQKKYLNEKSQYEIEKVTDMETYMRKIFKRPKPTLRKSQCEYNYIEPTLERFKENLLSEKLNLKDDEHYALAFQGGGAKGLAYVGVYTALRKSKSSKSEKKAPIPIKSIIGSSAGGIFALAVSTAITPLELQKICYTMNQIPKKDRIYIQDKQDKELKMTRQQRISQVETSIYKLLDEYGILSEQLSEYIKGLFTTDILRKLANYFGTLSGTFGQIVKLDNQLQPFNYFGLLLEGAMMKGEAIQNIAAECMLKYFFKRYYYFNPTNPQSGLTVDEDRDILKRAFSERKWKKISESLTQYMKCYQEMKQFKVGEVDNFEKIILKPEDKRDLIIAIINKAIIYLNEYCQQQKQNNEQAQSEVDSSPEISKINFKSLENYFTYIKEGPINQNYDKEFIDSLFSSQQSNKYKTLSNYQREFGKPFLLNPQSFSAPKKEISDVTFLKLLQGIFKQFQVISEVKMERNPNQQETAVHPHWLALSDIIAETFKYFYDQRDIQKFDSPKLISKLISAHDKLLEVMKQVTLEQYYELNQVQLTSTSVDLNDKTMRFFNHKTTPYLPVCKSVQMTGSFPFGFKAQVWKKHWGSYYVHYRKVRRQIDLTAHQFTDGGMLANFPIKYLDNEDIRSKYFSHIKGACRFLGFGLDHLQSNEYYRNPEEMKIDNYHSHISNGTLNDLLAALKAQVGWGITAGWKLFRSPTEKTAPITSEFRKTIQQSLDNVPLLRFLFKFLEAYPNADRNLNMECFSKKILYEDLKSIRHLYRSGQLQAENNQKKQVQNKQITALQAELEDHITSQTKAPKKWLIFNGDLKPKLQCELTDIDTKLLYESLFNFPQQILSKVYLQNDGSSVQDTLKNLLIQTNQLITGSQDLKFRRQNIILNEQIIISHHYKYFDNYLEIQSVQQEQVWQQIKRKTCIQIVSPEKEQTQSKLKEKALKLHYGSQQSINIMITEKILRVLRKKIILELGDEVINNHTIRFLYKRTIQNKKYEEIDINKAVLSLAENQLKNLYSNRQFKKIQDYLDFYNYEKDFYDQVYSKIMKKQEEKFTNENNKLKKIQQIESNNVLSYDQKLIEMKKIEQICLNVNKQLDNQIQENYEKKKSKSIGQIQSFKKTRAALQQMARIKQKQITKDFDTFLQYARFISLENNQNGQVVQNKFQKQIQQSYAEIGISNALKLWNIFFSGQIPKDEDKIIEKYFELQLTNKFRTEVQHSSSKLFQVLAIIFQKQNKNNYKIFKVDQDHKFFVDFFNKVLRINQKTKQKQVLMKKTVDYVYGKPRTNIFADNEKNLIQNQIQKWNTNNLRKFLIQKSMAAINVVQLDRIVRIIDKVLKSKYKYENECKQSIRQVLMNNLTHIFYEIIKIKSQLTEDQIQISKHAKNFLEQSTQTIYNYYDDPDMLNQEKSNEDKINQKLIIKNIIILNQRELRQNIDNYYNYFEQIIEERNKNHKINSSLIKFHAFRNSFEIIELETHINYLSNKLKVKQGQTKTQPKIKSTKMEKCKSDYLFFLKFLKKILLITANKLVIKQPFRDFNDLILLWQSRLQSINSTKDFLKFKSAIVERCRRYYSWIGKKMKKTSVQLIKLYDNILKGFNNFQQITFKQQTIDLKSQKKLFKEQLAEFKFFCTLSQKDQSAKILFHIIESEVVHSNLSNLSELYTSMFERIKKRCEERMGYLDQNMSANDIQDLFLIEYKFFDQLSYLENNTFYKLKQYFMKMRQTKFQIPLFSIDQELLQNEKNFTVDNNIFNILNSQVDKYHYDDKMQGRQRNNIHLILEGLGNSHLFYPGYLKSLENNRVKVQAWRSQSIKNKGNGDDFHLNLSAITCSNFHSVFGFLLATGMQFEDIRSQMNRIQPIAQVLERGIQNSFNSYKWAKCSQMEIKLCLEEIWNDQFNVFNDLEINYANNIDLMKVVKNMKAVYIAEKQKILSICQKSFENMIDHVQNKISIQKFETKSIQLCQSFGLLYKCEQNKNHHFEEMNQQTSKWVKQTLEKLYNRYESLVQYLITSQGLLKCNVQMNEDNRAHFWKGIIIKRLFTTYKLKSYICDQLKKIKLNPDITLKEFYMQSKEKILLTFTTVNNSEAKLQFMNKNTVPNMPVWAAILASTSLSFLYREYEIRKQWTHKPLENTSLYTNIVVDFFDKKPNHQSEVLKYVSGNLISSMPLELLTNSTVLQKMFTLEDQKQPDFIYLAILFDSPNFIQHYDGQFYQLNKKYFGLWNFDFYDDVLGFSQKLGKLNIFKDNCGVSYHQNNRYFPSLSDQKKYKFSSMLSTATFGRSMSTFTESNDNLIMSLYWDKIIKCPIKINTLDFHEITQQNKRVTKLDLPTEKTLETIERSYYITHEFINDTKQNDQKPNREMTFRIQLFIEKQQIQDKAPILSKKVKFTFLSHSQWNLSPNQVVIMEYEKIKKRVKVFNSEFVWNLRDGDKVKLYFYYPDKNYGYVIENCYIISLINLKGQRFFANQNKSTLFDYAFDYSKIQPKQISRSPFRKNRQPIAQSQTHSKEGQIQGWSSAILIQSQLRQLTTSWSAYQKHKFAGFKHQFKRLIEQKYDNREKNDERLKGYRQKHNLRKETFLPCMHCLKNLILLPDGVYTEEKCGLCFLKYGKLRCSGPDCNQLVFCLDCLKDNVIQRDNYCLQCVLCTQNIQVKDQSTGKLIIEKKKQPYHLSVNDNTQKLKESSSNGPQRPFRQQLISCYFCYESKQRFKVQTCSSCEIKICDKCINKV